MRGLFLLERLLKGFKGIHNERHAPYPSAATRHFDGAEYEAGDHTQGHSGRLTHIARYQEMIGRIRVLLDRGHIRIQHSQTYSILWSMHVESVAYIETACVPSEEGARGFSGTTKPMNVSTSLDLAPMSLVNRVVSSFMSLVMAYSSSPHIFSRRRYRSERS